MNNSEKKVVGIWIDNTHAYLFATPNRTQNGSFAQIDKIESDDHKDDMYKNDKVELAKERQEQRKMFKEITNQINHDDVIYIFGPGKAQEQLKNHLEENAQFNNKQIELGTSGSINTKQMIDHLEKHFA